MARHGRGGEATGGAGRRQLVGGPCCAALRGGKRSAEGGLCAAQSREPGARRVAANIGPSFAAEAGASAGGLGFALFKAPGKNQTQGCCPLWPPGGTSPPRRYSGGQLACHAQSGGRLTAPLATGLLLRLWPALFVSAGAYGSPSPVTAARMAIESCGVSPRRCVIGPLVSPDTHFERCVS